MSKKRGHISPLLNPQVLPPTSKSEALEHRRERALAWAATQDPAYPRLPYASWTDVHPWSGVITEVFYQAIAAGEHHWRNFLVHADAAQLDLVAAAAARYTAQRQRQEAA